MIDDAFNWFKDRTFASTLKIKVQGVILPLSDAGNPFPEAMANYETFHFLKGM